MFEINIRELVKNIPYVRALGQSLRRKWHKIEKKLYPSISNFLQKRALKKVRAKKEPLNVVFMVIHESVWKLDRLYWKMESSAKFHPTLVICPYVLQGKKTMKRDMDKAYSWYKERKYNVVYSFENNEWIDIKKRFQPQLVVFTNPHDLTETKYLPKSFIDTLSLYVPYGFPVSKYMDYYAQYNQISHNTIWKIFTTNQMDKQIFIDNSDIKGRNVEVSGYPGSDDLMDKNYIPKQVWKTQAKKKKKIIWAPHHSFEKDSPIRWSTFLVFADFMQNMAIKYSQEIQFSFRPHPLLKDKLYELDSWGKKRTDNFYDFWEISENTQSDMVSYTDLFLTSDAIIHDSGSFMAEYLYVNKPSLYLIADETLEERFSPFGIMALNAYEHGKKEKDIEEFIINSVLNGNDPMTTKREDFIHNHLVQKDNQIPSEFIFKYLEKTLR